MKREGLASWCGAIAIIGCLTLMAGGAAAQAPGEPTAGEPTAETPTAEVPEAEAPVAEEPPTAEAPIPARPAEVLSGEAIYTRLSKAARGHTDAEVNIAAVMVAARSIAWQSGHQERTVVGNLRRLEMASPFGGEMFLIRDLDGEIFVLTVPADAATLEPGAASPYAGLREMVKNKMTFQLRVTELAVGGLQFSFVHLTAVPERALLDRLFFIAIVLLLFLTMVGMGLTLTLTDFALVFRKPRGMIVGLICQFGLLPLLVMLIGRGVGYYETYPFIFLGMILIASSPGGVTSNLMTYLGKGDVALSVSLTAVCTVLALFFTPLLLTLYGGDIPDFTIPVMEIFKTMLVLVIVPLIIGMLVRNRAAKLAKKAEKPFAAIGVFALLFLIVVGIWSNLSQFGDTERYGLKFYTVVIALSLVAMVTGALAAKLSRVVNFQARAISLEVGVRNASLAMTIAILLQDRIGDFASSMFFTSGIFGLTMYFTGGLMIYSFKRLLPVDPVAPEA